MSRRRACACAVWAQGRFRTKPGLLDERAAERKKLLKKESAELEKEAKRLAGEIEELAGDEASQII